MDPLWLNSWVNTSVLHLARVGSDHTPLLISYGSQESSHHAFRFLNFWSSHSDFLQKVNKSWNEQTYGSPIVTLMMKLKRLKTHLKNWSWVAFGNILEAAKKVEEDIRNLESLLEDYPSEENIIHLNKAKAKHSQALIR